VVEKLEKSPKVSVCIFVYRSPKGDNATPLDRAREQLRDYLMFGNYLAVPILLNSQLVNKGKIGRFMLSSDDED